MNLREFRESKNLTLEKVGYLAGLDPATLSRVERALVRPGPITIVRLANAFGCSVRRMDQLISTTAEKTDVD